MAAVADMTDEMEGIVDGDADNDARYADGNHGDVVADECDGSEAGEPSPEDGKGDEQDVPKIAEAGEQDGDDEDSGDGDGKQAVVHDLPGVAHGHLGPSRHMCLYVGKTRVLHLLDAAFEQTDELCVLPCLAARKG